MPADSWWACRQLVGLQTAGVPADSWRACRQLAGLQTAGGPADSWRACRQLAGLQTADSWWACRQLAGLQTAGGPADSWRACRQLVGLQTAGVPADSWWACRQLVGLQTAGGPVEREECSLLHSTGKVRTSSVLLQRGCLPHSHHSILLFLLPRNKIQTTSAIPCVRYKPLAHGVYCGWNCHASHSDHGLTVIDHSMN